MKTNLSFFNIAFVFGLLSLAGCKESDITLEPDRAPLQAASLDETGGTWKTVLLKPGEDLAVATPKAITSPEYVAELAEVKTLMAARTAEQEAAARFWASGGVLRWNQLARQLVAKYNVAPSYNYTTNEYPFDPTTPFATPPFAARLYALLSVAQYDALVAVWKEKFKHARPSLSRQGVAGLLPATELPSYPSEDAAVAEASCRVLAFLMVRESPFLATKALEHQNSRLWAGTNVKSDVLAGIDIGKKIADKVIAYAKLDRFGAARDVNATWKTIVPYDAPGKWESQEAPYRAPMLPLLGKVKPWYDSTAIFKFIPGAPPKIGSAEFQTALDEVRKISDKHSPEQQRIAEFWSDGGGTSTPPGHWNLIAEDLIREANLSELRAARTMALLNRAESDAGVACWFTKYKFYLARPSQVDPKIKSSIGVPNFPSYTSGHSTFSGAASTVLGYLFPAKAAELSAMADEAGISRIYGGIHYAFDNTEGRKCGNGVGQTAVDWARADGAK